MSVLKDKACSINVCLVNDNIFQDNHLETVQSKNKF